MGAFKKGVLGFVLTASLAVASEKDDLRYLDEIFKQKRYTLAIQESKNFLQRYPESKYSKDIQVKLAKLYFLEKDYENARVIFLRVSQNYKNSKKENEELYSYLARIYAVQGNDTLVSSYMEQLPGNDKVTFEVASSYLQGDEYEKAGKYFRTLLQKRGKYYEEALINMALVSYNLSQYRETLQYLESYNKSGGEKNEVLMEYLYGFSYYKLGDIDRALSYFKGIAGKYPQSPYGRKSSLALIEIYSNSGNIKGAIEALMKLGGTKEEVEGVKIIGNYFIATKNYPRALDYYERILHVKNADIYYNYAYALYEAKEYKKAIKFFEQLKGSKLEDKGKYYIAASNYKLKNYTEIFNERSFLRNLKLSSEESQSLEIIIANSAYELGDYEIARGIYRDVYLKNPTPENIYKLAVLESRMGYNEEVLKKFEEYRTSFSADRSHRKEMYLLAGDSLHSLNRTAESEALYKEFLSSSPDLDVADRLVTVLLNAQKYGELMEYLNLQEANSQNRYLKGIASMGMGKYDDAQLYFDSLAGDVEGSKEIREKAKYNGIKNIFLKGEYGNAIERGDLYLQEGNSYNREDIVDRIAIGYFRLDNFEKSREYFLKLKASKSHEEYGQFQIAETYYNEKKYDLAKEEYRKVYLQNSKGEYAEKARYWEMNSIYQLGQYEEFKKLSKEFMKLYPGSSLKDNVFFILAELSQKNGKTEETLTTYKDLYTSSTQPLVQEDALVKIVEINEGRNSLDEGLKWAEKFKDETKKSYYKALFLEKKGDYDRAFKEYQKLETDAEYKDVVLLGYGNYWHHKGDLGKSQKYYEELIGMPKNFYKDFAQYQLADIKEKQGKLAEAARDYSKVYIMYPESDLAEISQLKAGEITEKQGKEKEALAVFEELYEKGKKKEYKVFLLEKIIYLSLKNKEEVKAKNYHNRLKSLDKKAAEKYSEYFKGGK